LIIDNCSNEIAELPLWYLSPGDKIIAAPYGEVKIKSIIKIGLGRVVNITVRKNHTMVTKNGIISHNCEQINAIAQPMLKRIMEDYAETCRFIFTSNNPSKIITPLRSRMQEIHLNTLDMDDFRLRMAQILQAEEIEINDQTIEDLDSYIRAYYPDARKCINTLQMSCQGGQLLSINNDASVTDYQVKAIQLFKSGKILQARKLICENIIESEYEDFYRLCYRNLDFWGETEDNQNEALLIIRQGLLNHAIIADPEINLSATLTQLGMIK